MTDAPKPPTGAKIIPLPSRQPQVEMIGFLTPAGRDLWVDDPDDIAAIMEFMRAQGIVIRSE